MRAALFAIPALLLATGVSAQDDIVTFSGRVPPNVMILFDTSASMSQVTADAKFDPLVFYDLSPGGGAAPSQVCNIGSVPLLPGSTGQCPNSRESAGHCPNIEVQDNSGTKSEAGPADNFNCPSSLIPGGCGNWPAGYCNDDGTNINFVIPPDSGDPSFKTRWSRNYLHYLVNEANIAGTGLLDVPRDSRVTTAQTALELLVNAINPDDGTGGYTENVRFGLAVFHDVDGGFVTVPIAPGNKSAVLNGIANIHNEASTGWTPISEALVDMGRYFVGSLAPLGSYPTYDRSTTDGAFTASPPRSPIDLSCRKNFVVIVTDGESTEDLNDHHGTAFSTTIGDYDRDGADAIVFPADGTDYLDDVAKYLADNDLIPDATRDGMQNVMTYTIGFQIDSRLLEETALNGRGEYYTTDTAVGLAQTLKEALASIIERATSLTAATVPAKRTQFGDGFFRAFFEPSEREPFWKGHLEAYALADDGSVLDQLGNDALDPNTGDFLDPTNPYWDAGRVLRSNASRAIYTTISGARSAFDTANVGRVELNVRPAELSAYSGYDMGAGNPADPNDVADAISSAVVGYVHGQDAFDEDGDGNRSELRDWLLGDIFHSTPVVVGPPGRLLIDEEGFGRPSPSALLEPSFVDQFKRRDRVVYAGANDGALHAFDAGKSLVTDPNGPYSRGTGEERFAYVPGLLLDKLKYLPRNAPRLHYYVDGPAVVADAWLGDGTPYDVTKEPSEWATVLLVGFRQGGPGYLALDVSDPDETTPAHSPYPKLLWEFSDPDLGDSWSEPIVTRIRREGFPGSGDHCGKDDGDGDCREQWVAVFGGGYSLAGDPNLASYVADPNDPTWSDRSKAIYMVDLHSGALLAKVGFDATSATTPENDMRFSIPSSPAVLDVDFDGFADAVYVGDLGGQMWKWDVSEVGRDIDTDPLIDNWPAGVFFRTDPVALPGGGLHYRSFFFAPQAAFSNSNLVLAFGSGERSDMLYEGTSGAAENNRLYVVQDLDPTGRFAFSRTLTDFDLTDITGQDGDTNFTDSGFYFQAEDSEKFVTNSQIFAGFVITTSYTPSFSSSSCLPPGTSRLYVFSLKTGAGFFANASRGGDLGRRIAIGLGVASDPQISLSEQGEEMYIQTSAGKVVQGDPPPGPGGGVLPVYWRQNF